MIIDYLLQDEVPVQLMDDLAEIEELAERAAVNRAEQAAEDRAAREGLCHVYRLRRH